MIRFAPGVRLQRIRLKEPTPSPYGALESVVTKNAANRSGASIQVADMVADTLGVLVIGFPRNDNAPSADCLIPWVSVGVAWAAEGAAVVAETDEGNRLAETIDRLESLLREVMRPSSRKTEKAAEGSPRA